MKKNTCRVMAILLSVLVLAGFGITPVYADQTAEAPSEETMAEAEGTASVQKMEGDGFETPEEALEAYILGLIHGDFSEMLAACAVESYVDHYDIEAQIGRLKAIMPLSVSENYLPAVNDFTRQLNLETRRTALASMAKLQYLVLNQSNTVTQNHVGQVIPYREEEYETVRDMIDDIYFPNGTKGTENLTFSGEYVPSLLLTPKYYHVANMTNRQVMANVAGAEKYMDLAAILYVQNEPYVICASLLCYDGLWYMSSGSQLALMLGLDAYSGNLISSAGYGIPEGIREYFFNRRFRKAVDHISNALNEIDTTTLPGLSKEDRDAFWEAETEKVFSEYEEDIEYLEESGLF